MSNFDNKGRINNNVGPSGHTHSIYHLDDIAAGGTDMDTLVNSNGIWTAVNGMPYAVASGQYLFSAGTIASQSSTSTTVNFSSFFGVNTKFTATPFIFTNLASAPGGSVNLTTRAINATKDSFDIYVYNTGASPATYATGFYVRWLAIQILPTQATGMISKDPNV